MKIILVSNLKNLGKIGDIVTVKNGYARNYLIPQGFAIYYSESNYKVFKEQKAVIEKQNSEKKAKATENEKKLKKLDITILENAGDDGKLYGSVSSVRLAKIANDLLKSNDIKKSNVIIDEVIKNIGKFKITFELHPEVSFAKEIVIARTKEEAQKIKSGQWEKELREKAEAERKEKEVKAVIRKEKIEKAVTEAEAKEEKKEVKKEEKKEEKVEEKKEKKKEKKKETKKKETKKAKK